MNARCGGEKRRFGNVMWPAVAAAALALATLAAIEPRGLFGDVRTRKSDDEVKPRLFDILS